MTDAVLALRPMRSSGLGITGWRAHLLVFSTLYNLFLIPAPAAFGGPVLGLAALVLAVHGGGWGLLYPRFKVPLLLLLGLALFNTLASALPGQALGGAAVLLRSLALLMPALVVAHCVERELVTAWMRGVVLALSAALAGLALWHLGGPSLMGVLYLFSEEHFGNVHNLVNVAAAALLSAAALLAFERQPGRRLALAIALGFLLWFQWMLKSEGSYLALAICAGGWIAMRSTGIWRVVGLLGILGCVSAYAVLVSFPDYFRALAEVSLGGFEARSELNGRLLELIAARPLTGYGMLAYKYVPETVVGGMAHPYPHQIYLEALFALWFVGTILFGLALYGIFRQCSRAQILSAPVPLAAFLIALFFAGKGLTDMRLIALQPLGIFMLAAGLMSGRPHIDRAS